MTDGRVHCRADALDPATLLTMTGTLDSESYRSVRDVVIRATLDDPTGVVVDITALDVPAETALAAFTSARWHVERWPKVPFVLVCHTAGGRRMLHRNGISRVIPVCASVREGIDAVAERASSRRAYVRADLSGEGDGVAPLRRACAKLLTDWHMPALIPPIKVVATALLENAMQHAGGATAMRLETMGEDVAFAVEDGSAAPPTVRKGESSPTELSSLKIVDALCPSWGFHPIPTGKVVWCLVGANDVQSGDGC